MRNTVEDFYDISAEGELVLKEEFRRTKEDIDVEDNVLLTSFLQQCCEFDL